MITAMISRLMILAFGTLYPAYASYKAVRTKDVREYVKWMMYWIVFALFTCAETFTDVFFSFWFPFYYEIKVALVIWLLSPATKGSSFLYRNFVHPAFQRRESEIDEMLSHAKERGYNTVLSIGSRGVSYATNVLLQTAMRNVQLSGINDQTPALMATRRLGNQQPTCGDDVDITNSEQDEFLPTIEENDNNFMNLNDVNISDNTDNVDHEEDVQANAEIIPQPIARRTRRQQSAEAARTRI